jgi:hypothetical protein
MHDFHGSDSTVDRFTGLERRLRPALTWRYLVGNGLKRQLALSAGSPTASRLIAIAESLFRGGMARLDRLSDLVSSAAELDDRVVTMSCVGRGRTRERRSLRHGPRSRRTPLARRVALIAHRHHDALAVFPDHHGRVDPEKLRASQSFGSVRFRSLSFDSDRAIVSAEMRRSSAAFFVSPTSRLRSASAFSWPA